MRERVQKILKDGITLTRTELEKLVNSNDLSGTLNIMLRYQEVEFVEGFGPNGGRGYRKFMHPMARLIIDMERTQP